VPFGIRQADRFSHIYLIGKTGVGKSTMIEHLAR
jgi:putative ribosome biogenesis GTPase RsgA